MFLMCSNPKCRFVFHSNMDFRNSKNVNLNIGVMCPNCGTVNTIKGQFDFDSNGNPTLIEALKRLSKTQLHTLLNVANNTKDGDFSKGQFLNNLNSLDDNVAKVIRKELEKETNFKLFILALIFYISIALNFKGSSPNVSIQPHVPKIENPISKNLEKKSTKNYSEADSALNEARRAHRKHQRKKHKPL